MCSFSSHEKSELVHNNPQGNANRSENPFQLLVGASGFSSRKFPIAAKHSETSNMLKLKARILVPAPLSFGSEENYKESEKVRMSK